jgi:hypothetical protein
MLNTIIHVTTLNHGESILLQEVGVLGLELEATLTILIVYNFTCLAGKCDLVTMPYVSGNELGRKR